MNPEYHERMQNLYGFKTICLGWPFNPGEPITLYLSLDNLIEIDETEKARLLTGNIRAIRITDENSAKRKPRSFDCLRLNWLNNLRDIYTFDLFISNITLENFFELECLREVHHLWLVGSKIPACNSKITPYSKLVSLRAWDCNDCPGLPQLLKHASNLEYLEPNSNIEYSSLYVHKKLKILYLGGTYNLALEGIQYVPVRTIKLGDCGKLKNLKPLFSSPYIEYILIGHCRIDEFPCLSKATALRSLVINLAEQLPSVRTFLSAPVLESLWITTVKGLPLDEIKALCEKESIKGLFIESTRPKIQEKYDKLIPRNRTLPEVRPLFSPDTRSRWPK